MERYVSKWYMLNLYVLIYDADCNWSNYLISLDLVKNSCVQGHNVRFLILCDLLIVCSFFVSLRNFTILSWFSDCTVFYTLIAFWSCVRFRFFSKLYYLVDFLSIFVSHTYWVICIFFITYRWNWNRWGEVYLAKLSWD